MRIKYHDNSTGYVEDLGQVGQPSGVYDFRTGEELLIGDMIEIEILDCDDTNISLDKINVKSNFPFLVQEEKGRPYVFGFQFQKYFSSENFNCNFRNNITTVLNESELISTYLLTKSKNGNIKELSFSEIPSYISLSYDE